MNIGELTVGLAVKGGDRAKKSLMGIGQSMKDVKSTSMQTKAALAGMAYGLQKMMAWSMDTGTGLEKFNRETGMSVKMLQRWQHAGRAINMTNDEIEGSFRGLQSKMSDYANGLTEISGMHRIGELTGGIDKTKLKDTEYVMKKLQEYAKAESDIGRANSNLGSFGLSTTMVGGLRRDSFNEKSMKGADTFTGGESKKLAKMNAAWLEIQQKMNMGISRIFSEDGEQLMKGLTKIVTSGLELVKAFTKMSDSLGLFTAIDTIIQGWSLIFKELSGILDKMGIGSKEKSEGGFFSKFIKDMTAEGDLVRDKNLKEREDKDISAKEKIQKSLYNLSPAAKGAAKARAEQVKNSVFNITVESKSDNPIQQGSTIGKEVSKIINREESTTRGN